MPTEKVVLKQLSTTMRLSMTINGCTKESLMEYSPGAYKISELVTIDLGGNITKWSLRVDPNGNKVENKSNISFYLRFDDFDSSNFSVKYRLGLVGKTEKGSYVEEFYERSGDEINELKGKYQGESKFISHEKLFNERSDLIVDGTLTLFCDLTLSTMDGALNVKRVTPKQALADDCKRMFSDELLVDFEFKMSDGKTLKAHKVVLAARSPVFLAMFTTDMKEARENFVNISEFDSVVMKEVLRYIYCTEVQGLDENVHQLIYAADKYQLDGLKEICVDRIIALLSTKNVLESLVIADRFNETKMFVECINFMASSSSSFKEIRDTQEWKDLPQTVTTKIISHFMKN